jgi:DNA-binding transcriptional ArsR family regulator
MTRLARVSADTDRQSRTLNRSIVSLMAYDTFRALAHPLRREIIERLSAGPATIGDVTRDFDVTKPTISRHLRMLEDAGVVSRVIVGRTHRLTLRPEALADAERWIETQRNRWETLFDVVDSYLEEQRAKR